MKLNNVVIEEYDYDSNGNRSVYSSTRAGLAGTSTYNDDDQLEANSNASYGYDANGRLATRTRNVVDGDPVITTYDYSSDGRLLSVTTPEHTVTYRHNAFGNRVAKLVDGVITEKYLWENKTRLLATFDGNNNLKHSYEYTVGNTPTSYYAGNQRYYILTDQLGSPRIITDSAGNVLREIEYDSYGNIIADSNPTHELPFGFAGGLVDQHTGLIRFGFRDYDPETGRWTARDPIGFAGGDTNLYGYVLGDPVNGIDPDGRIVWAVGGAIIGGAFGAISNAIAAASGPGPVNWGNVVAQAAIGGLSGAVNGALISTLGPAATLALNAAAGIGSAAATQATSCDKNLGKFLGDAAIGTLSGYMGGAAGRSASKAIFSGLASPAIKGSARPAAQLGQGIGAGIIGNGVGTAANYAGTGAY